MVFHDENRYRCACSCRTLPSRLRKRIQLVPEHTSSACRPPRSLRYFSVLSSTAIPAPRATRAAGERSKTLTSQPASRSTSAAVRPPIDPPTTLTVGISGVPGTELRSFPAELRAAERGDLYDLHLEQHPAFVHGRITQAVRRLGARVLRPDPVELIGDALTFDRVVFRDLSLQHRLDADPVVGIRRVYQNEGGVGGLAQPVDLLPVRGQVEEHGIALVVEPDRRQVGVLTAPHNGDDSGNRLFEQPPEAGVQIGQARHSLAFADRELAWLGALGNVLEFRHGN